MKEVRKIVDLVYGGTLEALEFAYRNGYHIFYETLEKPFHLDKTKEGMVKKDVLENYSFLLSCSGLNLNCYVNEDYRLSDNKITISGNPWIIEYHFDNLHNFADKRDKKKLYKVVDYINIRSCGTHDIRELRTEDNFVKEIYFYPSKRTNSSKNFSLMTHTFEKVVKDAYVVSYLTGKQIEEEEYSGIYSRLRLKEIMKEVGIKGKKSGTRNGKPKYGSIKLEFDRREINEIEENNRNYYYSKSNNLYLTKVYNYLYGRSA